MTRAPMHIRPAAHGDVSAVGHIVFAAYTKYIERIGQPPGPMRDDYAARVAEGSVWVAEGDGGVLGLIVLLPQEDHLLLDNIAVDPAAQGQGVGRALLAFADAHARTGGISELRLYTHEKMTENIELYTRIGWQETGRYRQDGFDRVFFRRVLP